MNRAILPTLALGGALCLGACETVGDVVGEGFQATLAGAGGAGGTAEITVVDRTDNLCYNVAVTGVATPTFASLRRGSPAGPVVTTLDARSDGVSNGCKSVPSAIIDEMERVPGSFFVVVGNAARPIAASGQLRR